MTSGTSIESMTQDPGVRLLVQFQRMEQLLSGLPGARGFDAAAEARALGVPTEVLRELRREFSSAVQRRAHDLVADDRVREAAARLPLPSGARIVCLGDSMTSDFQSWAEMLGVVLRELRPDLVVCNEGRSGDTTTDLLSRFAAAVPPHRPRAVVTLIGANDSRQHQPWPSEPEVSDAETGRNVTMLQSMISALGAESIWLTPPPVLDELVRTHAVLGTLPTRWDDAAAARKAAAVSAAAQRSVDLRKVFAQADLADLLLDDGLHPSAAGQSLIAAAALEALSAL